MGEKERRGEEDVHLRRDLSFGIFVGFSLGGPSLVLTAR
jgi:hypothetical protein